MRGCALIMALSLVAGAVMGDDLSPSSRCEITSRPEGALVTIDGEERGLTPLVINNLNPGIRQVRLTASNYEPTDEFITVTGGAHLQKHYALTPTKALLLVITEPAGAEITVGGISYGLTPRLIDSFDAGRTVRLSLSKPGYQPRTIEARFKGREPKVISEKLIADSGSLVVKSTPEGANVLVNGEVRGVTPLTVEALPRGIGVVELRLSGYENYRREVRFAPGTKVEVDPQLEALPAKLKLSSVPEGARVYLDGVPEGKTPIKIERIKPGLHELRAELEGHSEVSRKLELIPGKEHSEEVRLESCMAMCQLRTIPAGTQVWLNGRQIGCTKAQSDEVKTSQTLVLRDLPPGKHQIVLKCPGYAEAVRSIVATTEGGENYLFKLTRMFQCDVEIETSSGVFRGMLKRKTSQSVEVEFANGITRTFPQLEIRRMQPLIGTEN